MLDDPSKLAPSGPDKSRLYLPGSATSATSGTVAGFPVGRGNGVIANRPKIRLSIALLMLSLVAITALVLGMLFAVVPQLVQSRHTNSIPVTHKATSTSTTGAQPTQTVVQPSPTPTETATQMPVVQGTTIIAGLSASPSHFAVQSDCQVDNGYRCTVTLTASQDIEDSIHWKGSSDGVNAKFSPSSGRLKAGDQQQVIVYIYDHCPYNGTLIFTVDGKHITLPVNC